MRVLKLGGRVQSDSALPAAIAAAWAAEPGAMVVVHGGGDEISALQRALGIDPAFRGGRRVTGARDIDVLRMALSGAANKRLVAGLRTAGVHAIGLSGEDDGLLVARLAAEGALGLVGEPAEVNVKLLRYLLDGGWLPVLSPVGRAQNAADDHLTLNVNGDDAAAAVAAALAADELLLVADVPGVLVNGTPVAHLDGDEARALIADGTAAGGMAAKLEAALGALRHGVAAVRIGDIPAISAPDRGTTVTLSRSLV